MFIWRFVPPNDEAIVTTIISIITIGGRQIVLPNDLGEGRLTRPGIGF